VKAEDALTFNKAADLGTFVRREKDSPDVDGDRFGTYLKPGKCNLTGQDSLFMMKSPGTEEAIVVFFQMTIALSHPLLFFIPSPPAILSSLLLLAQHRIFSSATARRIAEAQPTVYLETNVDGGYYKFNESGVMFVGLTEENPEASN
jgi:hypothetical protein